MLSSTQKYGFMLAKMTYLKGFMNTLLSGNLSSQLITKNYELSAKMKCEEISLSEWTDSV